MHRRSKQLITMILFYTFAVGFGVWAVHHQDVMFWKYVSFAALIAGYLVAVLPQIYWLHQETKDDHAYRP